MYRLTALVTLLAIAFYFFTCINVSWARTKTGVKVPATSGHPEFERAFRIQMNTLECTQRTQRCSRYVRET